MANTKPWVFAVALGGALALDSALDRAGPMVGLPAGMASTPTRIQTAVFRDPAGLSHQGARFLSLPGQLAPETTPGRADCASIHPPQPSTTGLRL